MSIDPKIYLELPGKPETPGGLHPIQIWIRAVVHDPEVKEVTASTDSWDAALRGLRALPAKCFPAVIEVRVNYRSVAFEFPPTVLAGRDAAADLPDALTDFAKFRAGRSVPITATADEIEIMRGQSAAERAHWIWFLQLNQQHNLTTALKN